jgi:UDP-N-acetylglucosamine diphosphorylase/glucosamine-1-phosphate N-acetyltransferase
MRIGIFEDQGYINLQPLTYLRPVFDLRCGVLLLREKIEKKIPGKGMDYFARTVLKDLMLEKYPQRNINTCAKDDYLFLNGRGLFSTKILRHLAKQKQSTVYKQANQVIAAFILQADLRQLRHHDDGTLDFNAFENVQNLSAGAQLLSYPWEFVHNNPSEIRMDYTILSKKQKPRSKNRPGVYLKNSSLIWIAPTTRIDPGVVIDATGGPVIIDDHAHIFPQATIIGPAYIGRHTLIKIGAKLYEGVSIGEMCKVGGEVEESVIHSYANKQHDGFLGHAYLGQWVNLGADTNNSDLKNNYGAVRVMVNGKEINTGMTFVGLTMGDHSKTGINTMFNTGTVVGIMCNVYGSDFLPKWIPSFSWGSSAGLVEYDLEKALEVARKVMKRRQVMLSAAEEKLIRHCFASTRSQRQK